MKLTSDRVEQVFRYCLLQEGETDADGVHAEGVIHPVLLHQGRLAEHGEEIRFLLSELPDQFQIVKGGGWSFLNACNDRHGNLWTGSHLTMEHLFQLGEGLGLVKDLMPHEMWDVLPGGMPYFVVLRESVRP